MNTPFDPDAAAVPGSGLFGLQMPPEQSRAHILAVPFDATTSYRRGAANGPAAIAAASHQVDLYDRGFGRPYEAGIWYEEDDGTIAAWNAEARALADPILAAGGWIGKDRDLNLQRRRVDEIGELLNQYVATWSERTLDAGRLPFILGGDHSVPLSNILACAKRSPGLGILHIDAHADLRPAYEGFRFSHASILHNALELGQGLGPLLQVGLRDIGEREASRIQQDEQIHAVFDDDWARARMAGVALSAQVQEHLRVLPKDVYVTIDIDGLRPDLCPNTGTPVPGGLDWAETGLWLEQLVTSGRRIVGADLVEVSPGPKPDPTGQSFDAIVGARLLYRLLGAALKSQP